MTKRYALLSACALMLTNVFAQERLSNIADTRNCGTMEVLERMLKENPEMQKQMELIEQQTASYLQRTASTGSTPTTDAVITIPVVVHVVYNTAAQNVSTAMVQNQINVLNQDFSRTNPDWNNSPVFSSQAANTNIQFCLATVDPNGNPTTGITRTYTNRKSFSSNNFIKMSSMGGKDAWPADRYMNLWVGNLGQGLLGYAQFPGGNPATDGIVVLFSSLPGGTAGNYNKGRTATHEVGHWLNLRHIWGDATCGNDFVADTPVHNASNGGCPAHSHRSTCAGTPLEMWMNYMDYTYDACMYMFTAGQGARMNAVLAPGGARYSLLSSPGCGGAAPATAANTEAARIASLDETSVYPNPVVNDMTIAYTVTADAADVSLEIYNTMGVLVNRIIVGEQAQGRHTYQVDMNRQLGAMANGAYLCIVRTGDSQRAIRFMLAR